MSGNSEGVSRYLAARRFIDKQKKEIAALRTQLAIRDSRIAELVPVMGPAVATADAGKIMKLVWAYGDAMYQHGRARNDNDECPHYSEAQDVLGMFEPLLIDPTSITAEELEANEILIAGFQNTLRKTEGQLYKAQDELEALRKDAERYRFARAAANDERMSRMLHCLSEAALDAAIDDAIAKENVK